MESVAEGVVKASEGPSAHLRGLPSMRQKRDDRVSGARGVSARTGHFFARLAPERGTIFISPRFFRFPCANIVRVMSALARVNLVKNKNRYLFWVAEIDRAIQSIATSGTASATISSGGGSQSYTSADLDKLRKLRGTYASRIEQINMALAARPNMTGIRHVMTVRSGGLWHG